MKLDACEHGVQELYGWAALQGLLQHVLCSLGLAYCWQQQCGCRRHEPMGLVMALPIRSAGLHWGYCDSIVAWCDAQLQISLAITCPFN